MQAKADSEPCKADANTKLQKWVTEQTTTKKEVVTTVRRYYEYLPYSLLVQAQR